MRIVKVLIRTAVVEDKRRRIEVLWKLNYRLLVQENFNGRILCYYYVFMLNTNHKKLNAKSF